MAFMNRDIDSFISNVLNEINKIFETVASKLFISIFKQELKKT